MCRRSGDSAFRDTHCFRVLTEGVLFDVRSSLLMLSLPVIRRIILMTLTRPSFFHTDDM